MKKIILILLYAMLVLSCPAQAADCRDVGPAKEAFENFGKIVLFFSKKNGGAENALGYPEPLKEKNIRQQFLDTLKKNFSSCFKPTETPNIVEIVSRASPELRDSRNLIVMVELNYMKGHVITEGIEEYGYLYFQLYRPELSSNINWQLLQNYKGYQAIFPLRGDKNLIAQIDTFLSQIRPLKKGPRESEMDFWKNMWDLKSKN